MNKIKIWFDQHKKVLSIQNLRDGEIITITNQSKIKKVLLIQGLKRCDLSQPITTNDLTGLFVFRGCVFSSRGGKGDGKNKCGWQ